MNSNRTGGGGGGRGGYRKDGAVRKDYRKKDTYHKDDTRGDDRRNDRYGKDDSVRKEYRKDTYHKDDKRGDDHRKDRYGKDDSVRKEYRKDNTYHKDDTRGDDRRKDQYGKDDSARKEYRNDTYRKDDTRRDDRRKDQYGKDDSARKEYRNDTYRKDDTRRDDRRKDQYSKDRYGKDDSARKEYRKKDTYHKDDARRDDHRKDQYSKDRYGKDESVRKEYRKKDTYHKDDTRGDDRRKDQYGKDDSARKEYRNDMYRKDDTRRDDHRKDRFRKDDKRGDDRRKDRSGKGHYRKDDTRKPDSSVGTRQLVQRILTDFDSDPGDPERIADRILARRHIEHRDRRFVFELVYGVLRNRIYLDYVINTFIEDGREPPSDALRRILEIGAYQILFLDRVPDHAAVNEAVNLAKNDLHTAPGAGFVNAVLRKVINNKFGIALPDSQTDLSGRLSIEFSHPKWMVERWLARYGLSDTKKILAFNNERPAVYLRRKMRDISRPQFEFDMRTLCEAGGGYLNLYYKMKKPLEPENLRILQDGFCSVQAPSSGWVVALLGLRGGERVLDMCSAPGGKATLIAEIVDPGVVVACDRGRWKMKMTVEAVAAQNLGNVYPVVCDSIDPPFFGTFDKVLLDAPCSGSGVLQRHPDGRVVRTAEDIDSRVLLQRELLDSAAKLVVSGGVLVYSTCSLESEENEHQVEWFLNEHPEFKLDHPPDVIPAMYIDDADCLRITPYKHNMDGMFGARFKKG
jgi:16S rRNA (cytosine967-C5)-methyltransferase